MTSVVLVDDHPVFRDGLRVLLEAAGMTVVGETAYGGDAVGLLGGEPDVIVMDLGLPDIDGVEATRRLLAVDSSTCVLVLTMYDDDDAVSRALEAGARGYLVKSAPAAEIVGAIAAVASGTVVLGSVIAPRVPRLVAGGAIRTATAPATEFPTLSERERQVLGLIAAGLGNAAIAERLGVSGKTVANYVSSVLTKLRVKDRAAAGRLAAGGGWQSG